MTKTNKKPSKSKASAVGGGTDIRSFIKIQLLCALIYIAAFLIMCGICLGFDTKDSFDVYFSLFSFGAASFISGFIGGKKTRKNGIISGILYAATLNLIVILIALTVVGFKADLRLLITFSVLLVASAAGGIAAVNSYYRR